MDKSVETTEDAVGSRLQMDNNVLIVRMLEQTKQQDDKSAKETRIKNINRYLKSTQSYRSLGLISLSDFLERHSVNAGSFVSEKECQELDWIELILRFLDQKSETPAKCFSVLSKLLSITSYSDEMRKIIQSKFVRKIVESIVSCPHSVSSFQCLATLLREFSGPSGVFKNQIYDYCIGVIDEMNFELVHNASICLNLLQQTRGGEVGGSAHQRNWAEFHVKLLNSLDEQFIGLLATGEDFNAGKSEKMKLPQRKSRKDLPLIYSLQERFIRFKNICIVLQTSLTQAFPAPKAIQLNRIVSFVDKRTIYNQAQLNKKDGESHVPHILLVEIQKCLLSLLKATIIAVNSNILPHSKDVCDILWKCLKSTNVAYDEFKISSNLSLRSTVYDVLIQFLKVSPNNHFINKQSENFVKEALLDITPLQTEVMLTLPNAGSKAKKRKTADTKRTLSKSFSDKCLKIQQDICAKSLEFLSHLVTHNGTLMKSVLYKILQDKILTISFKSLTKELNKRDLYDANECRLKILELNYHLVKHSSSRNATPMSFSIEIFRKFKDNDRDPSIRQRAFELLMTIEALLHNRKDPIHFPQDLREFRDTWLFNEKIVRAFEQVDEEKFQQYEKVYHSNGTTDESTKEADNGNENENQPIDTLQIEESDSEDKQEEAQPIDVDEVKSDSEVEIVEEPVRQVPSKRKSEVSPPSDDSKKDKSPKKKQKVSAIDDEGVEDLVNSYLNDFCEN